MNWYKIIFFVENGIIGMIAVLTVYIIWKRTK